MTFEYDDAALRAAMSSAMDSFAAVVANIEPDQWDLASPCDGWTVFDVVDHVIAGERFVVRAMSGASIEDAVAGLKGIDTPDGAHQVLVVEAARALEAFAQPLDTQVDHPVGQITARRFLSFRVIDQLGHAWDIAAATGQCAGLEPDALAIGLNIARREIETLERSVNFATGPDVDVNTGDQLRDFLHALGRDERWRHAS